MNKKRKRFFSSLLVVMMVVTSGIMPVQAAEDVAESDATIYIDSDSIVTENFEGMGVQWDPSDLFDYTDEQWDSFYEKAGFLNPNIMRVMLHDADSYCIGFEEDGTPIYDWDSVMMQRVYKILDFAEENNVSIMLGEWRSISERGPLSYDAYGKTVKWSNPTWARMIVDCLEHLIVDKGYTCIKYYNMINEPNYYKRDHSDVTNEYTYQEWKQAITNLNNEMESSGVAAIENLKIVGPDVYDLQETWIEQSTSDEVKDFISLTEVHRYAPRSEVESGLIEEKLKTWKAYAESLDPSVAEEGFALGEMGLAGTGPGDAQLDARNYDYGVDIFDYGIQSIRAGLKFASVWGFEDSMHVQHNDIASTFKNQYGPAAQTEEGRNYVTHTPTGNPNIDNDIKIWGFWNELGEEMAAENAENNVTGRANTVKASDEQLKPWYYTWSMLCRYFPSGMNIVETTDSNIDRLRVTTGIAPTAEGEGDISFAVVNNATAPKTITLNLPNATSTVDLNQYFYYDGQINGETRPVNEKGQVLPYGTMEDVDLSEGVTVTLPANSCMILTSLGYDGESNPMRFTTGITPEVEAIDIYETTNAETLSVGETYQVATTYTPSISTGEIEWAVVDYFGQETDKATIDENGVLTVDKAGEFKVIGTLKENPEIQNSIVLKAINSSILMDELVDIENGVAETYENIVRDDNSANFNGDKTIKRSDSNAAGLPGIVTYQADNIYDFTFKAYSLNTNLATTGNFIVEASTDGETWEGIDCNFEVGAKLGSNWYPYIITNTEITGEEGYQYIRVTFKSSNGGYKTYDPQYAGGSIYYDYQGASEVIIENEEEVVVKDEQLQFTAQVLPDIASQEVVWEVLTPEGEETTLATIDENGVLTAKEAGEVVVVATAKDSDVSAYKKITIIGGYFIDEIEDFSKMYEYGDFTFDDAGSTQFNDKTRIKRLSDSNQSIVYALSDIEEATFEVYKNNGVLDSTSVDIYTSSDGITYTKVETSIVDAGKAATTTQYNVYEVTAKDLGEDINYIKLEVKNDSSVYCPMIGRTEIVYNPMDDAEITNVTLDQQEVSINVGQTKVVTPKVAPSYADIELTWTSRDENIATVDADGKVTAKEVGSTVIYATYNDEIYATSVINVLGENIALEKDVSASTETNQWDNNPSKALVNDGNYDTRWVSKDGTAITNEQITIDLGETTTIDTVKLYWEAARAKDFNIEVSTDGINYQVVKEFRGVSANNLMDDIALDPVEAHYVRMQGLVPATRYGYSIYEFEVYNNSTLQAASEITFTEMESELYLGEEVTLGIVITPEDATYQDASYTSSDESIITIKNEQLIAVGEGTATITASVNGQTVTKEITVVKDNARMIAEMITTLTIEDGKVVLPEVEGYSFSINSSDLEKVITTDGTVNLPVDSQDVNLVLTVTKEGTEDTANTAPIEVTALGDPTRYNALLDRIEEIEETNWSVYKPTTVTTFQDTLTELKEALEAETLLVSEVETIASNLETAFSALEIKSDKTTLDTLISEVEALDATTYTESSMIRVEESLEKAKEVSANGDASEEEISEAIQALQEAKLGLVEQEKYDNLKELIEVIEEENLSIYSEETVKVLEEQLASAKEALVNENITNQEVIEEILSLQEAYEGLQLNHEPGSIEAFIERIEAMDLSGYSEESVKHLEEVIASIKEQLEEGVEAETYARLADELQTAYDGLENRIEEIPVQPEEGPSGETETGDMTIMYPWVVSMIVVMEVFVWMNKRSKVSK